MNLILNPIIRLAARICATAIGSLRTLARLAILFGYLQMASASALTITLAWNDNSDDEAGFRIERMDNGGVYAGIGTVGANVTTYADSTAVAGTAYSYRVCAYNIAGNSAYSNAISNALIITTQPAASQTVVAFNPVSFTVVAVGAPPPGYKWRRNGVELPGATKATLTIPAATAADAGEYTVVVSNGVPPDVTSTAAILIVQKANQSIAFGALTDIIYGGAPFSISASATSGLPVAFGIVSGPATINGNTITISGVGTVVVRATQTGDANYNPAAAADQSFSVAKSPQNIVFSSFSPKTVIDTPFTINATASSTLPLSFSSSNPTVATVNGSTLTIVGVGISTITASQPGNTNYLAANDVTQLLTISKATPTIILPPAASSITFGQLLSNSSLSGGNASVPGSFSFAAPDTKPTHTGPITATITFTPNDTSTYNTATTTITITVGKATPSIVTPPTASAIKLGQPVSASSLSGGAASVPGSFAFTNPNSVPATVASVPTSVTFTPTDISNYETITLTVNLIVTPVIIAPVVTNGGSIKGIVGVPLTFTIAANNGAQSYGATDLPTGLTVNPANGAISGYPTVSGTFTATISARNTAGSGSATLVFTIDEKPVPSLTGATTASGKVGSSLSYDITATNSPSSYAASGLPAGLTIDTSSGRISGTPSTAGTFNLTLSATNSFGTGEQKIVLTVARGDQSVTITPPTGAILVGQPVTLNATANTGLAVTLSVVNGNATINGNTITLFSPSLVLVRANQSGDSNFNPASADITLSGVATGAAPQIYFGTIGPDAFAASIAADGLSGKLFTLITATGEALVVNLTINPDGSFNVVLPGTRALAHPASQSQLEPSTAAAQTQRTFRGRVFGGSINGTIEELGLSINGTAQAPSGSTSTLAGFYQADTTASASGTTYLVVGTQGQAYALSVNAGLITAGTGSITPEGTFKINTPQAATIEGTTDVKTISIAATIQLPDRPAIIVSGIGASVIRTDRLVNLSSRARVSGTNSNHSFIVGFVVAGSAPKPVLLRAVGPTLASYGVQNALPNPSLQLFDSKGQKILQNDDWINTSELGDATNRTGAFVFQPGSLDSALFAALKPGTYTMMVQGAGGSGVTLLEIYDAGTNPATEETILINLSSRGFVDSGEGIMIGGFVITGNTPKKVLIRAVGPGLSAYGVTGALSDPELTLYQAGTLIARNDNWEQPQPLSTIQTAANNTEISAAGSAAGAFSLFPGSRDAAIVIILNPGSYSAAVNGIGNTTGTALLEIYQLPIQ